MSRKKTVEVVLEPQGAIDITQARQVRDDLVEAIGKGTKVVLKLAGISDADLTFFQLLCSAHRAAAEQKKQLLIDPTDVQESLKRLLLEGGIARQFECQHVQGQKCLWCGEGW